MIIILPNHKNDFYYSFYVKLYIIMINNHGHFPIWIAFWAIFIVTFIERFLINFNMCEKYYW